MKQNRFHITEIIFFIVVLLPLLTGTYLRNGVWGNEIELWTHCIKKSPGKARPYVNLGFAFYNEENFEKAFEFNQKAIELDPGFANAYHNLGLVYQKMKDLDQAVLMVEKSIQLDPDLKMAFYSLGNIYFEKKEYEASVRAFKRFLETFPYFPNVNHQMGIICAVQRQFDKAIEAFELELQINPSHTLAHLNLGQIYWYEFQKKEKALKHLKAALALDPFLPNRAGIQSLVRQLERIL
ncbi:MAG: tetratricopeptide repeat protein [Deltaproteobacteria bacterium]|nr:tetratricopeptide repeat protein [Deltaproteobacteria bacterium]